MKFSGKICFKIMLKVTKNQGFTLSLGDTFFEKPQGGQSEPSSPPHPPRHIRVKGVPLKQIKITLFDNESQTLNYCFFGSNILDIFIFKAVFK